jgi:hypothetical protein
LHNGVTFDVIDEPVCVLYYLHEVSVGLALTKHFSAAQEMGNQLDTCCLVVHGLNTDLVHAQLSKFGYARGSSTSTRLIIVYLIGPIWAGGNAVYVALKSPRSARVEIELDLFFQRHGSGLPEWIIFAIEVVDTFYPMGEVVIHRFIGARNVDMLMPLFVPPGCVEIL